MENLIIEGATNLPSINFNASTHLLKIFGRSIPEHPVKFYEPLERWIVDYINTKPTIINIVIHLDYLNTHSTECLLIILKKVENYALSSQADIKLEWLFDEDDEDMAALGEDLSSIIDIPFVIKEIK